MYKLGDYFEFDYSKAMANEKNIIKGEKYRFTILSESLIRLEYDEEGIFLDNPTELVWYRNQEPVNFEFEENKKMLQIKTKCFKLTYMKGKPFTGTRFNAMANLKVEVLSSDRIWYYNHPEARNFGAPGLSLENTDSRIKLKKGLYSLDGFATIDDSKSNIIAPNGEFLERKNEEIDLYLFVYNKNFDACLKDYYNITGYPSLIPRYALGNWWYKDMIYNTASTLDLMKNFKDKEIPLSLILLNGDWNSMGKNTFTWNTSLFKAPLSLINAMHQNGVRLGLSINPMEGFCKEEVQYKNMLAYLNEEDGKIPFNVYDPKTIDVYFKMLINPLDTMGIDFYFIDADDKIYGKKLGILNHFQTFNVGKDYRNRPMILSRNASLGQHRYPVTYAGKNIVSWESLKILSFLNISSTNIGNNFIAHDIGGYYNGTEDNELYTRFVQLGTFSPIMKLASKQGIFYKREPWKWDYKTYKIAKDYLIFRHRLIPYLYSESYKYYKYGTPLIRPLYYDYSDFYDDDLFKNEYHFGSELFIAPIIKKKEPIMNRVIHKFFLPEGTWFDFKTGKKYAGKSKYLGFYKDEEYPCFVKAGSIIPFTNYREDMNINDTTPPKNMEFHLFPGKNNTYNLYEDDGVSELYKRGYYIMTKISYNYSMNSRKVTVQAVEGKTGIVPDTRNYRFYFRNTKEPSTVTVTIDGKEKEFRQKISDNSFVVSIEDIKTTSKLEVEVKGTNLDIEAVELFKDSVLSVLQDLPIETNLKELVASTLFSDATVKKKRIEIRKLEKKGLEKKFINLFLKLLEYLDKI